MAIAKFAEIPTIDCELVTISTKKAPTEELGLNTASQVQVEVQTETKEAVKLIVKGRLIAQKPEQSTITGNKITLTDNVFNPQLALILQGGKIKKNTGTHEVEGYEPPVAGSAEKGEVFTLKCYSAIYTPAGTIKGYECIEYPNCQGVPIALNTEDGVFRAPQYTINSSPNTGEAPYKISYVDTLPQVDGYTPKA